MLCKDPCSSNQHKEESTSRQQWKQRVLLLVLRLALLLGRAALLMIRLDEWHMLLGLVIELVPRQKSHCP
jgi:hypothetical protein